MLAIRFLGASETVTGSRFSVHYGDQRLLVDCGMFQGTPALEARNWSAEAEQADSYEAVLLTHAHIDHAGLLPQLVRDGYRGDIFCTPATRDLCGLLLPDSAKIQADERDRGPLYDLDDVDDTLSQMRDVGYNRAVEVADGVRATFREAGHILGSAWIELDFDPLPEWERKERVRVVFSGDVGRGGAPILPDPVRPRDADFLVLESTYGDKRHGPITAEDSLAEAVEATVRDRSHTVVPAFAVQRCQDIAYLIDQLPVPPIALFVDSPMAAKATRVFERYGRLLRPEVAREMRESGKLLNYPSLRICETGEQSRSVTDFGAPAMVVAASGMAAGGRVLHHLRRHLSNPRARVLLAGYQCEGTRGYELQEGAREIEIDGEWFPVRARVGKIHGLSGHADWHELDGWLSELNRPPALTMLVHGDDSARAAQRARLAGRGWSVTAPLHGETVTLVG